MKTTSSKVSHVSDKAVVNDLATKVFSGQRRRLPFIIGFLYYIFKYLISVGAYVSRSFLRYRLGERTFGIITVLSVYLFFLSVQLTQDSIESFQQFYAEQNTELQLDKMTFQEKYDILLVLIGMSSSEKMQVDMGPIATIGLGLLFRDAVLGFNDLSFELKVSWWIILGLSILHFLETIIRRLRGDVGHSYFRGKSAFFGFLTDGKIFGFEISPIYIWMVLEPALIYFLAFLFESLFDFTLLSAVLKISAICLFFEEYRVYLENRSMLLDIIDSQIDAEKLSQAQTDLFSKLPGDESKGSGEVSTVISE
jgi:hypothetical protein